MVVPLKFVPFSSAADASFWHALTARKVDEQKLSEEPQTIWGSANSLAHGDPLLTVTGDSFNDGGGSIPGTLHLVNTLDAFKKMDRVGLFHECAKQIHEDICCGEAGRNPNVLSRFIITAFADLKKYKFFYWFAFPALTLDPLANIVGTPQAAVKTFRKQLTHRDNTLAYVIVHENDELEVKSLTEIHKYKQDLILGFADPCGRSGHPGWTARNLLTWLRIECPELRRVKLYCQRNSDEDIVFDVTIDHAEEWQGGAVGWEKNPQSKLGYRTIDLGAMMDPTRLAETGVDLNLKLMRWRLLPTVDLERLAKTRVLLIGAGTVGCAVARTAMGWGIRHLSFIDNGKVSYSNPVRQSLYEFEDCTDGGAPKAPTAAKKLKAIFPGAVTEGYVMQIPMPGHTIDKAVVKKTATDVEKLSKLIDEHDVVYLTTDSRESRWLPTMLCASKNKLCINIALGFDSYVVMRHGIRNTEDRLGCYFCNDVVAPSDSQTDRTLDQQCTVTRPGVAYIASAIAVELMVSVLHHPMIASAPGSEDDTTVLGRIPHQIRGFLAQFNNMLIQGQAYSQCTACSDTVVDLYAVDGFDFLLRVFNESGYLEDITGLTELHKRTDEIDDDFAWDSENELL